MSMLLLVRSADDVRSAVKAASEFLVPGGSALQSLARQTRSRGSGCDASSMPTCRRGSGSTESSEPACR